MMMRYLEMFARRMKLSGTPEELESFRDLKTALDGCGDQTDLIQHDAYISLPRRARIGVGQETPDCITHSFSQSSPPAERAERWRIRASAGRWILPAWSPAAKSGPVQTR